MQRMIYFVNCLGKHKQNLSNQIATYTTKSLHSSDVWVTDNPVQKLMINKPQPVLINVLIRAIFEH